MSWFTGVIYLLAFMTIFLGVQLHQNDIEYGRERNIYNFTENQIQGWNSSLWQVDELNFTDINMSDAFTFRLKNIIYKSVDLFGYTLIQSIKLGVEFGYEKAYQYEPERFISLAKVIFIVMLIGFIIPIIVPVLALTYLLFEGLKWIIKRFKNG